MDETQLDSKIAELKRNWRELDLKKMEKCEFTPAEWRALARYCLDPNDAQALRAMPIKLADFTAAAKQVALRCAEMEGYDVKENILKHAAIPAAWKDIADLAVAIDEDCNALASALSINTHPVKRSTQIYAGKWDEPRQGLLHTDEGNGNLSIITGRIGLPGEAISGAKAADNKKELAGLTTQQAQKRGFLDPMDDGGVYLLPIDTCSRKLAADGVFKQGDMPYDLESRGILHKSVQVTRPTPSVFVRFFCHRHLQAA